MSSSALPPVSLNSSTVGTAPLTGNAALGVLIVGERQSGKTLLGNALLELARTERVGLTIRLHTTRTLPLPERPEGLPHVDLVVFMCDLTSRLSYASMLDSIRAADPDWVASNRIAVVFSRADLPSLRAVEDAEYRTRLHELGLVHAIHVVSLVERRARLDLVRALLSQLRLAAHRLTSPATKDSLSTVLLTTCDSEDLDESVVFGRIH